MIGWMRGGVVLALGLGGCLPGPDYGGQEGEEVRDNDSVGTEEAPSGDSGDFGGGDSSGGEDSGIDGGHSVWTVWTGALTVERGLTAEAGGRDCVLTYRMEGSPSPLDCADCAAVFDVAHILEPESSDGLELCPDAREAFAVTYGIVGENGDVQVMVGDGEGGFVEWAEGSLEDGALSWTVGEADVPEPSGDETVYRTALETADVQLR